MHMSSIASIPFHPKDVTLCVWEGNFRPADERILMTSYTAMFVTDVRRAHTHTHGDLIGDRVSSEPKNVPGGTDVLGK